VKVARRIGYLARGVLERQVYLGNLLLRAKREKEYSKSLEKRRMRIKNRERNPSSQI